MEYFNRDFVDLNLIHKACIHGGIKAVRFSLEYLQLNMKALNKLASATRKALGDE